jgi:DNA-binding transcriptional ArsR family regulator
MDHPALEAIERAVMAFDSSQEPTGQDEVAASLGGLAEDLVDLVAAREYAVCEPVYRRLQRVLDRFVADKGLAIEQSDGCVAGQLRAFATVLGVIAQRAPDTFDVKAQEHVRMANYHPLFEALLKGEATTSELARATREQKETVSRKLGILRNLGLVSSYSLGRNVYSQLSPVARELYEPVRKEKLAVRTPRPPSERPPVFLVMPLALMSRFGASDGLGWEQR